MTKDFDQWELLQTLFHLAEEAPEANLDELLANACDDIEIRQRAKTLIEAGRRTAQTTGPKSAASVPNRVGPYTIVRHLGSGGVGTVYLAERVIGGAVQRAALKMLSQRAAGPMFAERFAREQHILASMEHANITRMIDAGESDEGHPYLVMEYVDGIHLDKFCDEGSLSVPERIDLFLQLCEAISYAHRNLIVHLDLKPSNVLVTTSESAVKVLDFGTSKLIQPDSLLTTTVMATPAYASPEQLLNEPVTTLCDVYALGAILFELLSGRRPNQDMSVALLIERSMKEFAPESITEVITAAAAEHRGLTETRLRSLLSGDLTTIVGKCLNPRPKDRYATVDALITDLHRYQSGRPVLARPQTTTYRLGKFVRRNRVSVTMTFLATSVIVGSLSYAAVRQHEALRNAERAVQMQAFMSNLFELANTHYMGKPAATVSDLLNLGAKVLPEMIRDPADKRAGALSLAESMYNNADYASAKALLTQVISDSREAGDVPIQAEAEGYGARVAYKLGDISQYRELSADALRLAHHSGVTPSARVWIETFYVQDRSEEAYLTKADLDLQRSAIKEAREAGVPKNELAYAMMNLAFALQRDGTVAEQKALGEEALSIYNREPFAVCDRAGAEQLMGVLGQQINDPQSSVYHYGRSIAGYSQCSGPDSRDVLEVSGYLGLALVASGQSEKAAGLLQNTVDKLDKLSGPDSLIEKAPLLGLSRAYLNLGDYQKSADTAARLLRLVAEKVNPLSSEMGAYQSVYAEALAAMSQNHEALLHAELAEKAYTAAHSNIETARINAAKNHVLLLDLRRKAATP